MQIVGMRACVCVCPHPRLLITSSMMWHDLSIANGTGGVDIFNFSYFNVLYRSYRVNNKVIDVLYILILKFCL